LRAPSALTPSRFWRSSKPPRSPTTEFEVSEFTVTFNFGRIQMKCTLSKNNS
jgi:hypothetical protein